jgi:sulfur relay protein TusB/DsrH
MTQDRRALLVVATSPAETALDWQLDTLGRAAGRGVLLIQDGVGFATTDAIEQLRREGVRIHALGPSLEARGMRDRVAGDVEVVDWHGAIDLIMGEYDLVV